MQIFHNTFIYSSCPRSIFKKPQQQKIFRGKSQKLNAIKTRIFSLTSLLLLQTIHLLETIRNNFPDAIIQSYRKGSC